jgi:hypothetical protein
MTIRIHPAFHRVMPFMFAALVALVGGSIAAPSALAQVAGVPVARPSSSFPISIRLTFSASTAGVS